MVRLLALLVLAGASVNAQTITQTFGSGANLFNLEFEEVGNPVGSSVGYSYRLGKYEISRDIVLKAVSAGGLGITLQNMSGYASGGNGLNRPATGISWYEAAIFVNWLNTSTGNQVAYKTGGTATAYNPQGFQDWSPQDAGYNSSNKMRNNLARFFLPSSAEWNWGNVGTSSGGLNTISWSPVAGGTDPNTAVFNFQTGPADVTNAGGLNGWGIMGMIGNVWEWNEDRFTPVNFGGEEALDGARMAVGAHWGEWDLGKGLNAPPSSEEYYYGFRVAMIPEPSSLSLLLAGGAVLMAGRRKAKPFSKPMGKYGGG